MKILVTGGSGYKGAVLIPKLLQKGYKVVNIDKQWFGLNQKKHKNLKNFRLDVLDIKDRHMKNIDAIIHLASIANDPMAELDKNLSWETSALGTKILMDLAVKHKIKRIIYASSGSVYGIKKERKVHEDLSLEPISLYNKVKMVTERLIQSYKDKIEIFIVRPATVCGYSPRMRLDVTVNILTYSSIIKNKITVFGGKQIRPNIHIDDITDIYLFFLKCSKKLSGIYNAGFENSSITKIARLVRKHTGSKIQFFKNHNDPRSYRQDSTKLLKTGFKPKKSIEDAIKELIIILPKIKIKKSFFSIKTLKKNI